MKKSLNLLLISCMLVGCGNKVENNPIKSVSTISSTSINSTSNIIEEIVYNKDLGIYDKWHNKDNELVADKQVKKLIKFIQDWGKSKNIKINYSLEVTTGSSYEGNLSHDYNGVIKFNSSDEKFISQISYNNNNEIEEIQFYDFKKDGKNKKIYKEFLPELVKYLNDKDITKVFKTNKNGKWEIKYDNPSIPIELSLKKKIPFNASPENIYNSDFIQSLVKKGYFANKEKTLEVFNKYLNDDNVFSISSKVEDGKQEKFLWFVTDSHVSLNGVFYRENNEEPPFISITNDFSYDDKGVQLEQLKEILSVFFGENFVKEFKNGCDYIADTPNGKYHIAINDIEITFERIQND